VWAAERDLSPTIESKSSGSSTGYPAYVWHTDPAAVPSADFITGWLPVLWALLAMVALGWPTLVACATTLREGFLDTFWRDDDPFDPDSDEEEEDEVNEGGVDEVSKKNESKVSAKLLAAVLHVPPEASLQGSNGDWGAHNNAIFVADDGTDDENTPVAYDQPFAVLGRWLSV